MNCAEYVPTNWPLSIAVTIVGILLFIFRPQNKQP